MTLCACAWGSTAACGARTDVFDLEDSSADSASDVPIAVADASLLDGADAADSGAPSDAGGTADSSSRSDVADRDGAAEPEAGWDAAVAANCVPGGPGLSDCGASHESCCTSLLVTGGTYYRTYDLLGIDGGFQLAAEGGPTGEADPATISSFRLDKYAVTVGRFRQFVNAWNSGYAPPAGSGKHTHLNGGQGLADSASAGKYEPGWAISDDSAIGPSNANLACGADATWTNTTGGQENLPINCVNWYESYAFCIWDGGFLPSEAEWEYGAAGGNQQREYPWGSTEPGTACPGTGCEYAIYGCYYYPSDSGLCTGLINIAPVGTATLGVGLYGQLDLVGNMRQWNLDWANQYVDPCTDCAYLSGSFGSCTGRALRGGEYFSTASELIPSRRYYHDPESRAFAGFRCARTP